MSKFWWTVVSLSTLLVLGAIFFRSCCVTFVDSYELAYRYDLRNGQISRVNRTGYILHAPFVVDIDTVDLRPMQVCINANSRVLNCKLVAFDEAGLELFLSWHGRGNYRGVTSMGESGNLNAILMSYAYDGSGRAYPFLKVLRELKNDEKQTW
jgi:hypothetical protein